MKLGIVKSVAREIGNKSREFYEFVLPPVDMHLDDSKLTVIIDVPGFKKEEIKLVVAGSILHIKAAKPDGKKPGGEAVCSQRPDIIDKKILLPIKIGEGEEKSAVAKYSDGVLTLTFPVSGGAGIPIE